MNVTGLTPNAVLGILMDIPIDERPSMLLIGAADKDAWRDYMPRDMRSPRCTGCEPWIWRGYGYSFPIRVHVTRR